jgi:hypothetical protein
VEEYTNLGATIRVLRRQTQTLRMLLERGDIAEALEILRSDAVSEGTK